MRLPFDLLSQNYIKPNLFLCETDKTRMCQLDTISMSGSFKFNSYSELDFTVGRTYTNMITGETQVNPFYDKIEALRLVELEGFGYFEIQDPEITSDGIKEVKNVTAYGLEYTLSQKYIEDLNVNTGEVDSVEVIVANGSRIIPVTLYNKYKPELSLLDIALEKIYGWKIKHVDDSLATMSRQFEISRASVYDFIVQDVCEKFNCFAVFDTINNEISLYAEALITKHIGDGAKDEFLVSPAYDSIDTVSIDSYKTTKYTYYIDDNEIGHIIFDTPPASGARIEITDGSQAQWKTDVYVTFTNLAQEVNVSYSAEDIKTVLTVKGDDDLDIREVNMGLPYIVDISYYYTVDWMGQDLYDAYTKYLQTCAASQSQYAANSKEMLELTGYIAYETQRLSLQYSIADNVTSTTVGTYYVRGGTAPDYYYREIQLPDEYNANIENYYMLSGSDLDEEKFAKLYAALQTYFVSEDSKDVSEIEKLQDSFEFVETYTLENLIGALSAATNTEAKDGAILTFFDEMWGQLGSTPLDSLYYKPYQKIEATNKEAGWDDTSNENYWRYYPITLVLESLEKEIEDRKTIIEEYNARYTVLQNENSTIATKASIYNNFSDEQLARLGPFLREDEYTDDNFVETDSDTIEILMQTKQELLECGKIELTKLCEPKLSFSMDMANIYALIEFEPIIHQFQLGNLINVAIRDDYIKQARLLAVDINFDDFSDFSCEFGELTNLKTPSSIHADLLANALAAGNSVASNQSYWEKGTDLATSTDIKIQNGLLSAIDGIYNADKSVLIDNHGILLRKVESNGEYSPYQIWLTNNNILVSTDAFTTADVGVGVFEVDGKELYGVLAKAVLAGYIEGSTIVGGTININDTFIVDEFGNVTMNASSIKGYVREDNVIESVNNSVEALVIDPDKISLTGKQINLTSDNITIDSTNFSVTTEGAITATSGEIAGWTIYPGLFRKETTVDDITYQMYMQSTDGVSTSNAFAVRKKGSDDSSWDVQFAVNYAGKLTAKNANITGAITANSLTLGDEVKIPYSKLSGTPDLSIYIAKDGTVGTVPASGKTGFQVSSAGLLQASNAVIYGTIYASGGTIAGYNIGAGGSYGNALYKRVVGDSADYEVGFKASSGDTDLAFYVKKSTDDWSSSSNVFYVNNSGKLYAQNVDITGKINASSGTIGSWTIGDMGNYTDSIYTTYCAASAPSSSNPEYAVFMRGKGSSANTIAIGVKKRTSSSTSWNDSDNPFYVRKDGYMHAEYGTIGGFDISSNYLRSDITKSGTRYQTFMQAADGSNTTTALAVRTSDDGGSSWTYKFRVNYDGSAVMRDVNITGTSTIDSACIGNLNASKITAGTFSADRIPNLSAAKITSGTISTDRLSSSVITTSNFSSKSLSTGNLTVTGGSKLGYWNVTTAGALNCGSGTSQVGLTSSGVSHGSGWTASWYDIIQAGNSASDERLKQDITEFDDHYDNIFDNLRPVKFRYNIDPDRLRLGFIAQDVKKNFESEGINDFGGVYVGEGDDDNYRLLKEDFIALNTWQIQKLKGQIKELEERLAKLEA